jgi:trigger factor
VQNVQGQEKSLKREFPADWRVQRSPAARSGYLKVAGIRSVMLVDQEVRETLGGQGGDIEQFRNDIPQPGARAPGRADDHLRRGRERSFAAYEHVEMPPRLVETEARAMVQRAVEQAKRSRQIRRSRTIARRLHGCGAQASVGHWWARRADEPAAPRSQR